MTTTEEHDAYNNKYGYIKFIKGSQDEFLQVFAARK